MSQISALSGADVMNERARCDGGRGVVRQTEAVERAHSELALEQRNGVIRGEDPGVKRRAGPNRLKRRGRSDPGAALRSKQRRISAALWGEEHLVRLCLGQFVERKSVRLRAAKLGGAEVAGRKIKQRNADARITDVERGKKVIAV